MKDYPIVTLAGFFIIGILFHNYLKMETVIVTGLLAFCLILILLVLKVSKQKRFKLIIFSPAVFLFALLICSITQDKPQSPLRAFQKEKNTKLFAEIKKIELKKNYEIVFNVEVDSIFINGKQIRTNDELICKFRGDSAEREKVYGKLNPGNIIYCTGTYLKGREQRNPYEYDYNKYLNSKNITGLFHIYDSDEFKIISGNKNQISGLLYSVRKKIDDLIHLIHYPQTAGLLRGLLLGDRSEIDFATRTDFINSGVVHILAVSGLHTGYILFIFILLFGRFGIYTRSVLTIAGLLCFMFITGSAPSVTRATIMSVVLIVSFLSNRSSNIINSAAIAAVLILIINPNEIYNPGFQLSFAAVLSIGIVYPRIRSFINSFKLKNHFIKNLFLFISVSLSAQIGTLPFTLVYFSKFSIIALLTNLVVIPVIGFIIGNSFITIIAGLSFHSIAVYFGAATDLITGLLMDFVKFTGNLVYSFVWIRHYTIYDSIVFYFFLGALLILLPVIKKIWLKIIVTASITVLIFFYSSFDNEKLLKDNLLSIMMIDVGQGDSFLIQFPNGKTALIDAGEANQFIDTGERIIIPLLDNLGIEKIDYGFISHLDLDHYGGFVSLLHNNRINEIYRPLPDSSEKSLRFEKFLTAQKIKSKYYEKSELSVGNVKIYFLNNPFEPVYKELSSNDRSGVLKIVFGRTSFLFTGDCEFAAERMLIESFGNILDSDVLKVGHHGSSTGSSFGFLKLVSPKISLVSSGIKNKFDHPSESVIVSLRKFGSKIYRTDFEGAILLQSDSDEIKKIEWKK